MTATLTVTESQWKPPPLLGRLDFYAGALVLTRFQPTLTSYPVAPTDVVAALSRQKVATGWLPRNCLFWCRKDDQFRLLLYVPARRWQVELAEVGACHLPMPAHLFAGVGRSYRIYALRRRPRSPDEPIFGMPVPNVDEQGRICNGSVPFPECRPETIETALAMFWSSRFSHHLTENRMRRHATIAEMFHWYEGRPRFRVGDLLPTPWQVRDVIALLERS